jgi:mono/diheme cytochrome c family protein
VSFDTDVYPILDAHCIRCHGPNRQRGGLRLDSLADVEEFIVAGNADASLLIEVVELPTSDPMHMPKNEDPLPAGDIETLRAWVDSL